MSLHHAALPDERGHLQLVTFVLPPEGPQDHARNADFLDGSVELRAVDEVSPLEGTTVDDQIAALCERLAASGITAYAVDVTAPDIAAAGLRVAKVVAPELQPLDVAYDGRFLGGRRLYDAAFARGLAAAPATLDQLNPYPHPFP